MPSSRFLVSRIDATPDAVVTLSAAGPSLPRREARNRAQTLASTDGCAAFVGTPNLRGLEVRLPGELPGAPGSPRVLAHRIGQWLDGLRAHGTLRLERLAEGATVSVPARFLTDPEVLATLGVVLAPPVPRRPDQDLPFEDWFTRVPKTSIAGLLRAAGQDVETGEWLAFVPRAAWRSLTIPLYAQRETAAGWCVGWWARHERQHAFLGGQAMQLSLTARSVEAFALPVDPDDGWRLADPDITPATDPAWQHRSDPRLDRVLSGLPKLAEAVMIQACSAAIESGAAIDDVLQAMAPLRRRVDRRLASVDAALREEIVSRMGLVGLRAPRLAHADYLHVACPEPVAARRRQALAAWPQLADELATGRAAQARDAIDTGTPLVPSLAADFGVPPWAIRRLLPLLEPGHVEPHLHREPRDLARVVAAIGTRAPRLTRAELRIVARWLALIPAGELGTEGAVLLRAIGSEAARDGWAGVAALLEQDGIGDDGPRLLAWWDQLRANIFDGLSRSAGQAPPPETISAMLLAWLDGVPVSTQLRLAAGWHDYFWGPRMADADGADDGPEVPALFGPLTLVGSRVRVEPLLTRLALRDEGKAQRHCVGAYWAAVATGRRLVMALRAENGERATHSFVRRGVDQWLPEELRAAGNQAVPADHPLGRAAAELATLLGDAGRLSHDALAWHRDAGTRLPVRGADYAVNGACLLSALPERMQVGALRWMPGAGSLEQRLAIVYNKLQFKSRGFDRATNKKAEKWAAF